MTFFSVFDVPVFWPILLCYWIVLFVLTMKRQILHMIKYKYVPFSMGKQVRTLLLVQRLLVSFSCLKLNYAVLSARFFKEIITSVITMLMPINH
jgi:hypothetical protein